MWPFVVGTYLSHREWEGVPLDKHCVTSFGPFQWEGLWRRIWGNWAVTQASELWKLKWKKRFIQITESFLFRKISALFADTSVSAKHLYHLRHLSIRIQAETLSPDCPTLNIPFDWKFHSHARSDSFASRATLIFHRDGVRNGARWLISPVIFSLCHFRIAGELYTVRALP